MGILRGVKPEIPVQIIFGGFQSFSKPTFWEGNFESVMETGETFRLRRSDSLACRVQLSIANLAALTFFVLLAGCGNITNRPELYPDNWAPQSSDREWIPPGAVAGHYTAESLADRATSPAITTFPHSQTYDLAGLIDIALRNNPETWRQWEAARSAAAQFGAAEAPYYPQADVQSINGYERTTVELPGLPGKLNQWQSQPVMEITYTLLDFGRRYSAAEAARNRLIANNFTFNRAVQDVVFGTQSAYYAVDAAQAAVTAAQQNLTLAQTDFDGVKQRVDLGLATEPELLLAKERVAQSRFDLANAHLLVHDAEAQLAVALGVPANKVPATQGLENQAVPNSMKGGVEQLIARARRGRPDLAARVANLHASEADVSQARAQYHPVVGLSANYGENLWNFTFDTPRKIG